MTHVSDRYARERGEDNRGGRPTLYTRELADSVLALIVVEAMSLTAACEAVCVKKGTFLGWVVDDIDGLFNRYQRSKKIRAWARIEEIGDIADDGSNDWMEQEDKKGNISIVLNREHVARSELRVKTRQWEASKILRNEFGDKLEIGGELALKLKGAREQLAGLLGGEDPEGGTPGAPESTGEGGQT